MYQVGFGDCFLVSFEYADALDDGRSERHMLVDFGSTRRPPKGGDLEDVAQLIREHTGGRLDVIVVSHRHKDHLSGFAVDAAAEIIGNLQPRLIVRSWTEDPTLASDAQAPARFDERSLTFVRALRSGQALAGALAGSIPDERRGLLGDLRGFAAAELANQEAVQRLDAWADGAGVYLHYGASSGIETLIPGIGVRVLGPPTLEQWPEIARQREEDPEFWMLHRAVVDSPGFSDLVAAASTADREAGSSAALGPEQWLIQRMRRQELRSLLRIVRVLDDVLNNTSLILLIQAGPIRMLFPGDAQIENWNFALKNAPDREDVLRELALVDLYKVGHHGSRNATPRTLFGLWADEANRARPMYGLMSTLSGVHGDSEATAVPRATLVTALGERMALVSTEGLPKGQAFALVEADLANGSEFRPVEPAGNRG
jgi:hypothetical protein